MKRKEIIFAFKNTVASRVLNKLDFPEKYLLDSNVENINKFVKQFASGSYRILGLGQYSGRDFDKLRIETICNNRFRNRNLEWKNLRMRPFLKPKNNSKFAKGLGNSFCNLVSLGIINSSQAEYAFVHIPKRFNVDLAVEELAQMLEADSKF